MKKLCRLPSNSMLRLVLLPTLLVGCAASGLKQTGIRLGDETLKQFKMGETREDWLIAVVGPPTSQSDVPGEPNSHVLRYSTSEKSSGLLDFINGGSSRNTSTIYFVTRNGTIISFWADREKERTLLGKEVEKKTGEKQAQ